jgi:5'-methylthioadenosine phosphorylase
MAGEKTAKGKGARTKSRQKKSVQNRAEAIEIGVIGGSGLYSMPGLQDTREVRLKTPFGDPSDAFVVGTLEGKRVVFLARHGRGHRFTPTELNYRANMYAMKLLGVQRIISVSAVGSFEEELRPGEFLIPDQFFDGTKGRKSTFFGDGIVAHVTFGKPVCPQLSAVVGAACRTEQVAVRENGTYFNMEGPQFSTLAESEFYRAMKFTVVGMTNATEAKLAREAEICYSTVAMVTDYDCWHPQHDSVTVATVLATLQQNAANAQNVLREAIRTVPSERACKCGSALQHAILTDPKVIPAAAKKRLAAIVGKYV